MQEAQTAKIMRNIRTRIAPSPTGFPHIGTIYQALFDYAFAKKNKGVFFVRIEDTDQERLVSGAEEKIFEALDWFGLTEDESVRKGGEFGPYKQSERLPLYQKYAKELVEKGGAYYCFCTKERLEEVHKKQSEQHLPTMYDKQCRNISKEEVEKKLSETMPFVIRLKIPENTDIVVRDEIRGEIHFDSNLIEDAVLLKSDGYPTYHLASAVVDDHLMQTTHLVRGEEWLSSLPKHWIALDYFGWEKPLFFHTPVLRNPDKSKLSKRHGHTNVSYYKEEGFLPEAMLNYLALMAWSHPEGKEIFPLSEFIQYVELKDMKPVGPIFDIEKLKWMNGEYIRKMSNEELLNALQSYFELINDKIMFTYFTGNKPEFIDQVITLIKTRIKTLKDVKNLYLPLQFSELGTVVSYSAEEKKLARTLFELLSKISNWNKDAILEKMKEALTINNAKGKMLYKIFTGKEFGLPLPETLVLETKEKTLQTLSNVA